jgi:hypothetical protein
MVLGEQFAQSAGLTRGKARTAAPGAGTGNAREAAAGSKVAASGPIYSTSGSKDMYFGAAVLPAAAAQTVKNAEKTLFSLSRKKYELEFGLADIGMEAHITVCWQTPGNQDGPYCPIVSRIIA